MSIKHRIVVIIFFFACCILMSLLFLFSMNNFLELLSTRALNRQALMTLPEWMRPFYSSVPSLTALLSYCLFSISAFLFLKETNTKYRIISIISFILLACLFIFFF